MEYDDYFYSLNYASKLYELDRCDVQEMLREGEIRAYHKIGDKMKKVDAENGCGEDQCVYCPDNRFEGLFFKRQTMDCIFLSNCYSSPGEKWLESGQLPESRIYKKRVLRHVCCYSRYIGCTFYLGECFPSDVTKSYFENCSFRDDAKFSLLDESIFINCGFHGDVGLYISYYEDAPHDFEIDRLRCLTHLQISGGYAHRLDEPGCLDKLTELKSLHISQNYLQSLSPEITKLQKLQTLVLTKNRLTKLSPEIGNLQSLRILDISSNNIEQLPMQIVQCRNLETIDLSNNKFSSFPQILLQLPKLSKVILSENQKFSVPKEGRFDIDVKPNDLLISISSDFLRDL